MTNKLTIEEITNYLPHRYPFLLVDRVEDYTPGESIKAIKNVTMNEQFFQGHFPVKPVMPGVLIVEALAQAAGILAYKSTDWEPETSLFYLAAIEDTRFKKMVTPGDRLELNIEVLKRRSSLWKFKGEAVVDGEVVCSTQMTSMEGKVQ